jgi:site-specific recombinase XerD
MIEDMQIRNLSPHTQRAYVEQVVRFARHFRKSPEHLGPAEIRTYLLYLAQEKHLAASSIIVAVSALRFFYTVTLKRRWVVGDDIPTGRQAKKLPVVMSQEEVARFLAAVDNLKHRVILTVCYATGLRGRPSHPGGDRQSTHGHPGRAGQGSEGSLCHAATQTARYAQGILEAHPSRTVAVPG